MGLFQSRDGESQRLVSPGNVIHEEEESVRGSGYRKGCIFIVPRAIRQENERAYSPVAVAIGPLNHSKFEDMESEKQIFMNGFLGRTMVTCEYFRLEITILVPKIRECYKNSFPYNNNEVVEIMLRDGLFILEILLRDKEGIKFIGSKELEENEIRLDIMILENQCPMFILEKMYKISGLTEHTFLDLVFWFFRKYNQQNITTDQVRPVHFTDLLRCFLLPPSVRQGTEKREERAIGSLYPATELQRKAGLQFKLGSSNCLLEIELSHRCLRMSRFEVDDHTEAYLSNLLIYEDSCYRESANIFEYLYILMLLVQTEEDVNLLIGSGVIADLINNPWEIAEIIKRLTKGMTIGNMSENNFSICKDLIALCNSPDNETKAEIYAKCFDTPRKKAGTITLAVTLIVGLVLYILRKCKLI